MIYSFEQEGVMSWFSDAMNWVGDQYDHVADWFEDAAHDAWAWLSDNISGMPLDYFAVMGTAYPSIDLGGVQYFIPTHPDRDVNAVLSGSQWSGAVITYSMPDSRSDYETINPSASGFKPLSYGTQQAFHSILKGSGSTGMRLTSIESFTNVTFSYAGRDGAALQLSAYTPGDIITRSHAYYPGVPVYGGDLWIKNGDKDPVVGSYQHYVLLHELGHALGLKHTHEEGSAAPKMSPEHDRVEYSVMSYNVSGDVPQTYMMYDIAALQEMYGADFTTNGGNTLYKWDPSTGETFVNGVGQGTPGWNKIFLTIWDGGGADTYDLSSYSSNAVIDLSPGGIPCSPWVNKERMLKAMSIMHCSFMAMPAR
jgi:serralysin